MTLACSDTYLDCPSDLAGFVVLLPIQTPSALGRDPFHAVVSPYRLTDLVLHLLGRPFAWTIQDEIPVMNTIGKDTRQKGRAALAGAASCLPEAENKSRLAC